MRRTHLELTSAVLTFLTLLLLAGEQSWVRASEQDFADDGIVENEQDEVSPSTAAVESVVPEIKYESPQYDPEQFFFVDHFDNVEESNKRWIKSQAKKDDIAEEISKYDGIWNWEPPQRIVWSNDIGLVLKSKAKHAAIASRLSKVFTFKEQKPLVIQYEVTMQEGQECGGSYIKLLSSDKNHNDLTKFNDKTPYTIMFGPDKCGNDFKMHFIFRHVNPINGSISEKHCRKPKDRLEEPFKDKLPHLYTLVVRPDNTFEVRVDHKIINEGSLLSEFVPPVNPPSEIDDPKDKKPEDWDEREKIPDPTAQKPVDWDDDAPPQLPDVTAVMPDGWLENEPEMIPDSNAKKPDDWDIEIDGYWEAPLVENPICEKAVGCGPWKAPLVPNKAYKGKWRAPLIDNPDYRGKWSARKIPNPDYYEDLTPFRMTPIGAIGIELWSMSSDILFDNMIVTDDIDVAKDFAAKTFDIKRQYIDKESESVLNKVISFFSENPWSWKIAIVLLGTPLAFFMYRLFSSGSSKESPADAKKTDALQADDEVSPSSDDAKNSSEDVYSSKPKKSDLDIKTDDLDVKTDDADVRTHKVDVKIDDVDGRTEDVSTAAVAGASEEEVEADVSVTKESDEVSGEEKHDEAEETTTKTRPRKRRVRKDQS